MVAIIAQKSALRWHYPGRSLTCHIGRWLTCLGLLCWCHFAHAAVESPPILQMRYAFSWNSVPIGELAMRYHERADRFYFLGSASSTGLLQLLYRWQGAVMAEGAIPDQPVQNYRLMHYQTANQVQGKLRTVTIERQSDDTMGQQVQPPEDLPIGPELRRNASLPAAALLNALARFNKTERCDGIWRIWDGRRRFNIAFQEVDASTHLELYQKPEWLQQIPESRMQVCEVRTHKISNADHLDQPVERWTHSQAGQKLIWFAKLPTIGWFPFKVQFNTRFGATRGLLLHDAFFDMNSHDASCRFSFCQLG
ncbi:MAG: hypothetical protein AAF418_06915 [Pseudomonadota bacterium]